MAQVDIIQLLKKDGGEKFYPVTHVDAVIGLKDASFFEKVDDGNGHTSIKLKSEYTGLWADGWIAAGGIGSGSGGGGGLIQTVYTWSDIQEMSNAPEDDTASAFNAKTVYEIYKMLQAGGLDGGGYLKESGGGFFLTSSEEKILLKGEGHSLASLSDVSIYNPAVNDLLVWSGYSWVNVPQSSVRPDLSGYVTTVTFNNAIAGLQAQIAAVENFFEIDGSGNVTLKSPYQNLWVSGWLAAGGIGSGSGGGGGSQVLDDLLDVTISSPSNGDVLVYNGTAWVNGQAGGGADLPAVWASLTNTPPLDTYANTTINIAHIPLTDLDTWVSGKGYASGSELEALSARVTNLENESFFTLDGSGNITLKATYSNLWVPGWLAAGGSGSGGGLYTAGTGIDITNNVISLLTASTSVLGGVRVDGTTITINDGVISAVGGGGGTTYTAGYGISISSSNKISLKAASENEIGGLRVKVPSSDPSSGDFSPITTVSGRYFYIQRTSGGVAFVNVPGGGGTVTSVGMTVPTGFSVTGSPVTGSGTLAVSLDSQAKNKVLASPSGAAGIPSFRELDASDIPNINASKITAGTLDAARIPDLSGKYVTIDTTQNNISGEKTFSTNPVHIGATSGIDVDGSSYIDIGNVRLKYDLGTNALHVTKKSGTQAVGLYADGFVAAGGIPGQTTSSYVDLESNQSVGGIKTFTGTTTILSGTVLIGATSTSLSSKLFVNGDASFKYDSSHTISISNIVSRLEALE